MSIDSIASSLSYNSINLQNLAKPDANKLLSSNDADGSGGLDKSEFAALGASVKEGGSGGTFSQFDLNGDGEISAEEMRKALEATQENVASNSEDNTSSMLNELMSQNFQAMRDIMDSSSHSANNDDMNNSEQQSPVVNKRISDQIQEYMKQAAQGSIVSESVSSLI